ncbi:hypothetical protein SERLA73DRAFT_186387 [Serpula lacrymans var. lacrymans S7.3]|uniref:Protein OS-9 homolog n=2 Tax=Serpula lacrymans var. lacrymans TaxID=341189 RepID=F8Q772_SERL3|nr:uncharacterized protein SERLADRAFT_475403 [Serpula lacrymans var. lacrymans S7.9]EGN95410.1 hypothetical protein SERLA73DRAFT_186387 [Serpula lacrymans var. lacrymans S7.3]EGO20942.1 hypothetical protein SERLADRAFT_475403 [Serpula lacrymans var. lacrymans S7.9]
MRSAPAFALAVCVGLLPVQARLLYSGPEDVHAFPKHRVTFLNNLPVLNETAQRWLRDGLRGGAREFLDETWNDDASWHTVPSLKEIGSGDIHGAAESSKPFDAPASGYMLEHMKLGPQNSFLCLVPPTRDIPQPASENSDLDATLGQSWSLLQPLSGKCLYHRQTWFTYSYCHNQEIRQFRELPHAHPHPPGGYEPAEDPEWESYTLGRAPPPPESSPELTFAEQDAQVANLEVARGPSSRYLVQRWGDGTPCDKTGKPREVEVQFHCSMTMTDSILLVREAKTCSYVLVVQTPKLCGQPGFKSRLDTREEAFIRCREIIDPPSDKSSEEPPQTELADFHQQPLQTPTDTLNESSRPLHLTSRRSPFTLPVQDHVQGYTTLGSGEGSNKKGNAYDEMLKRTLEAILSSPELQALSGENPQVFIERTGENGEFVLEIVEEIPLDEFAEAGDANVREGELDIAHLADVLRKAGIEVKGGKEKDSASKAKSKRVQEEEGEKEDESRQGKDEL